jgi:glucose/arabinose dehydrogenase
MRRRVCSTLLIAVTVTGCSSGAVQVTFPTPSKPPSTSTSTPSTQTSPDPSSVSPTTASSSPAPAKESIATGLPVPWGLALLPDGSALVTLRDQGEVLVVAKGSAPVSVGRVPGVVPDGEGGLLGIAVSPTFASDQTVFAYLTSAADNRVIRMTLAGGTLTPGPVIVEGIPKAGFHNGGRLAFGPDGYLYVSTGDAGQRDAAQDKASLGGKILRVTAGGAPAPGNPFPGSRVWSLGHRNVQGLAWSKTGAMYASEFGQNTWDELNRILPGQNYGWPVVEGITGRSGFVDPIRQWTTAEASPSGIAVGVDGAVYMAALRGESLWRIPLDGTGKAGTPERLLQGTYGRLRTVVSAPDGRLWLVTNNSFRGTSRPGDDRVVALRLPVQG